MNFQTEVGRLREFKKAMLPILADLTQEVCPWCNYGPPSHKDGCPLDRALMALDACDAVPTTSEETGEEN